MQKSFGYVKGGSYCMFRLPSEHKKNRPMLLVPSIGQRYNKSPKVFNKETDKQKGT